MAGPLDRLSKLDSRLRCVANGRSDVNAVRARQCGSVRLTPKSQDLFAAALAFQSSGETIKSSGGRVSQAKRGAKQSFLPDDVEVSVFVLFNRLDAPDPPYLVRRNGRVGVAVVKLSQLAELNDNKDIQLIELGETLKLPNPMRNATFSVAPPENRFRKLNEGKPAAAFGKTGLDEVGKNVLVGIIDVGGLDFAHPDFLNDAGDSRVIAIWDQGGDAFPSPELTVTEGRPGKSTGYGSEIKATDIASAMRMAKEGKFSAHDFAPQSVRQRGSHATHVASIAAGRSGICKRASIAGVMIALSEKETKRGNSFYDTTRIIDGLAYLFDLASREKFDAISVNISLGTNGGPHDGSEFTSRWIDTSMYEPGRAICVAAGNSGQDAPQFESDLGFMTGRVHARGKIASAGLRHDLEWIVAGNGVEDVSENQLTVWYGAEDELVVELFAPNGQVIGPVSPGQHVENLMLTDRTFVSIYNRLSDPKNGDNQISIYLSPFMGRPTVGITAGSWKVRLTGKIIRAGNFNAWIERDDPGRADGPSLWRLPSYFGPDSYVDAYTVSSLACGPRVTGVANLDEAKEAIAATSSQGPTRDGRLKPEIAAPGTDIVAANGFDPVSPWVTMSGTSMASPYVAGVSALMLSLNPRLTAAQVSGIIRRTAQPLPGNAYAWQNSAGFGVIDAQACLVEAIRVGELSEDLTKRRPA